MPEHWLARYRRLRRPAEAGFWVVVLGIQAAFNSVVSWLDLRAAGAAVPFWQPLAWEASSALLIGALVPVLAWFERRYPLRWGTFAANVPRHLAASIAFCIVHVLGMVWLRQLAYAAMGEQYRPAGGLAGMFGYEYLKDVRTYFAILVAFWSYRLVLVRLQGEARVLDAPDAPAGSAEPAPAPVRPERFLVKKLRKEFLIAAADIEWLQAQGNYVGLHVNGHDYLLRSTLTDFLQQLDPARFVRVHRSYVVNLDRIAEIEPLEAGDARLRMKDGSEVPCSRTYREALASPA